MKSTHSRVQVFLDTGNLAMRKGGFITLLLLAVAVPAAAQVRDIGYEPAPTEAVKPKLYLLSVGVGAYRNPQFPDLLLPPKDARDVAAAWQAQAGRLYREVEVRVLTDQAASREAVLAGLEWLETQATQKDLAVLFFAGHGIIDPRTGEYLFLTHEADLSARRTSLVPDRDVRSALASIPGKVLVFLDTCHAGSLLNGAQTRGPADLGPLLGELAEAGSGIVVFAAAGGEQLAQELPDLDNGAFTLALLEALSGKGDLDRDGSVRISEIEGYLGRRVRDLTGGLQTPVSRKPGGVPDFPVAVLPGVQTPMPDWPHQSPVSSRERPTRPEPAPGPLKTATAGGFLFELSQCRSDGHEVTCDLFVTSQKGERSLYIASNQITQLVDNLGNEAELQKVRISNSEHAVWLRKTLVGGVRTSVSLTFEGLPADATRISLLAIRVSSDYAKFRDIPLQ